MDTETPTEALPRPPLSRERILLAAVRLADDDGLESLTMRRLAQFLGVEAMSLYNHVENKGDILDGLVELVISEIELPLADGEWRGAVRACAVSAHEVLLRHPWACSLAMAPTSGKTVATARMRYIESILDRLRGAGLRPALCYHAYHAIDSHVLGFTLWQVGHSSPALDDEEQARFLRELDLRAFPRIQEHLDQHVGRVPVDDVDEFEFGLDLLLDGITALHESR